jgi:hypothetical protein
MDAWIDCMTSLGSPEDGMTTVHGTAADPVVVQVDRADAVPKEICEALVEGVAFVNRRRLEVGEPAILVLSLRRVE